MPASRRYSLLIACFSYGGNGGMKSEHPDVRDWLVGLKAKLLNEPRIETTKIVELADTPIPMCRNRAVLEARAQQADLLLMIDSDMCPDCEPDGKPFWDTSFEFLDRHYDQAPIMIGAPYCGPSPHQNVYVFHWTNMRTKPVFEWDLQLEAFSRHEAAMMTGIRPVGALPTGLILFDVRLFDAIDPMARYRELRTLGLTDAEARAAAPHWFDYEWSDAYASAKASTEDVVSTRNLSLAGYQLYGTDVCYCNWDAWAGHWKPELVVKPRELGTDHVSATFKAVVERGTHSAERKSYVNFRDQVTDQRSNRLVEDLLHHPV